MNSYWRGKARELSKNRNSTFYWSIKKKLSWFFPTKFEKFRGFRILLPFAGRWKLSFFFRRVNMGGRGVKDWIDHSIQFEVWIRNADYTPYLKSQWTLILLKECLSYELAYRIQLDQNSWQLLSLPLDIPLFLWPKLTLNWQQKPGLHWRKLKVEEKYKCSV